MFDALISASELLAELHARADRVLLCDTSFDLADVQAGERAYAQAHLPGAVYLHLDRDLSSPRTGRNGRHPLPEREAFAQRMAALGANASTTVVAYDRSGGMYAARLWWMLRWLGHGDAAVLDGGLAAWQAAGGVLEAGPAAPRPAAAFPLRPPLASAIDYAGLRGALARSVVTVVDARAPDRFRGENETLDPVGGRIPGALNRCFRDNLDAEGRFKPATQLRDEWTAVIADREPSTLVQQCGSGVTACHNLLALHVAGLPGSALYPGSWSEWCAQPDAPVAVG